MKHENLRPGVEGFCEKLAQFLGGVPPWNWRGLPHPPEWSRAWIPPHESDFEVRVRVAEALFKLNWRLGDRTAFIPR
jgi:hypothetical protein